VESIESFWLASRIAFKATPEIIRGVAARSDVNYVSENFIIQLPELEEGSAYNDPEWNIHMVQADACWTQGITGEGVVVGTIDTGVEVGHPAFHGRWRSTNGWCDGVNGCNFPYDDNDHGTMVMGIICGGDGFGPDSLDIGVAPGAQFIAAKGIDQWGHGQYLWLLRCFNWMASDGRPNILNLSWGLANRNSSDFWQEILTMLQLRIFVVAAIGNNGPAYYSSMPPGSFPIVMGVGAVDENDLIADFSARGCAPVNEPWSWYWYWQRRDWNYINPEIVAPGVDVRTATPASCGYCLVSGTSLAAPHVAGCYALLCQKTGWPYVMYDAPVFYNFILDFADRPHNGEPYPNNDYGWGRLNCFRSVRAVPRIVALSCDDNALVPSQGKHIIRCPGSDYISYTSRDSIYLIYSEDGGFSWSIPEFVAIGFNPCLSLTFDKKLWLAYISHVNTGFPEIHCLTQHENGVWSDRLVLRHPGPNGGVFSGLSFTTSNFRNDAIIHPGAEEEMGYIVVGTLFRGESKWRVLFIAFDTLFRQPDGSYYYNIMDLTGSLNLSAHTPCISRTPGDYLHITWVSGSGALNSNVYYQIAETNPELIRSGIFPCFSEPFLVGEGVQPIIDAYGDIARILWCSMDSLIYERNYNITTHRWSDARLWDIRSQSNSPAGFRNGGIWVHQGGTCEREITVRFPEDLRSTSLVRCFTLGLFNPQADIKLGDELDTLYSVWVQRITSLTKAVYYGSFLHFPNADRCFYRITCGEEVPSPLCVRRDGRSSCANYQVDLGDSILIYHLKYLQPLYQYRICAKLVQDDALPLTVKLAFLNKDTILILDNEVVVNPGHPVDVWFDLPQWLYQDGGVDFAIIKITGRCISLAGIELHELESEVKRSGDEIQSWPSITELHPELRVLPTTFNNFIQIYYKVGQPGRASLKIHDVSGRVVAELVNGRQTRGNTGYHGILTLYLYGRLLPESTSAV